MKIEIKKMNCLKCGHSWTPRLDEVRYCPKCKTAWFDREPKKKPAQLSVSISK